MSMESSQNIKVDLNCGVISLQLSDGTLRKVDGLVEVQLSEWSAMTKFDHKYSLPYAELLAN